VHESKYVLLIRASKPIMCTYIYIIHIHVYTVYTNIHTYLQPYVYLYIYIRIYIYEDIYIYEYIYIYLSLSNYCKLYNWTTLGLSQPCPLSSWAPSSHIPPLLEGHVPHRLDPHATKKGCSWGNGYTLSHIYVYMYKYLNIKSILFYSILICSILI